MGTECGCLTGKNIDAVLKFLTVFEQEGYQFGEWEVEPDLALCCVLNAEVAAFEKMLYEEGFIYDFNWPNWQEVAVRYYQQPKLLDQADLETICKLLTTHVRKDRFCEGHLLCMLRDDHIPSILRRLKEIRKKIVDGQDQAN